MTELASKIGVKAACAALNIPRGRFYKRKPTTPQRLRPPRTIPLSADNRAAIRALLNSDRFMDMPPRQIYATLLDEGVYVGHWRTMYRILQAHGEVKERRPQRKHPIYKKPELLATAPNQVWSWDITNLRGASKWTHFKLYTVLDIFSRYVVGWLIADHESSALASQLIEASAKKQGIRPETLTLHADNGAPMTGKPLSQLLVDLGITQSHSRPHTSNDNPFSEAQFKTLKYCASYPGRFDTLQFARTWADEFFTWYNEVHYHSGLRLFTPSSVHYGEWQSIHSKRQAVLAQVYQQQPQRFTHGLPQAHTVPQSVWLNPPVLP